MHAVEWFKLMWTDEILLKCQEGHSWNVPGLEFNARYVGPRSLGWFNCPTCAELERQPILLKFDDPDHLRIEGLAE